MISRPAPFYAGATLGRQGRRKSELYPEASGGSERVLGIDMRLRDRLAVLASRAAGLGASTERLVNDGLDGTRASAAFGAATEAAIDLLGIARELLSGTDGVADIVVAEDVAGTNNHENAQTLR
jgi:hypothetical protein